MEKTPDNHDPAAKVLEPSLTAAGKRIPFWIWMLCGAFVALAALVSFLVGGGTKPSTVPAALVRTESVTGMEFVRVPGGSYRMGDQSGEGDADERPAHMEKVESFWIGRFEVTQGEWHKVMGANPSRFKQGSKYPVENVSFRDVQGFIARLSVMSGHKFRLPTEAEWEYACRSGGRDERYCGGDSLEALG